MNYEQLCALYELKERIELMELVRDADDERIRLILTIASADPRRLEAALSASQATRDM